MKNSKVHELINFTAEIKKFAVLITQGRYSGMYAIDINVYGIAPYLDDAENSTLYRDSVAEMAHELFEFDTQEAFEFARLRDAYADEKTMQGR